MCDGVRDASSYVHLAYAVVYDRAELDGGRSTRYRSLLVGYLGLSRHSTREFGDRRSVRTASYTFAARRAAWTSTVSDDDGV